jgi:hypothetical protein
MHDCAKVCRECAESCRRMSGSSSSQTAGAQERVPADDL